MQSYRNLNEDGQTVIEYGFAICVSTLLLSIFNPTIIGFLMALTFAVWVSPLDLVIGAFAIMILDALVVSFGLALVMTIAIGLAGGLWIWVVKRSF